MAERDDVKGFNGVCYAAIATVTAQDVADGSILIDFSGPSETGVPYPLAFSVMVMTSAGVYVPLADAVITVNEDISSGVNGQILIEDGAATFALVANQTIHVIGVPSRAV